MKKNPLGIAVLPPAKAAPKPGTQQPGCGTRAKSVGGSTARLSECRGTYDPATPPGVVLFLDVDGVLHPAQCKFIRQQFRPACLKLLIQIIQATGAEIVLSTAWRLHKEARDILAEKLKEYGLPVFVGRTANIDQFHRSREILAWVRKYKPSAWVAVDDWPLLQETDEMMGHFVNSRPRTGMEPDKAEQIIALFREQGVSAA